MICSVIREDHHLQTKEQKLEFLRFLDTFLEYKGKVTDKKAGKIGDRAKPWLTPTLTSKEGEVELFQK